MSTEAKEKCKSEIYVDSLNTPARYCSRVAIRGGFCGQHHPDAQKDRDKKAERALKQKTHTDYVRFKAPQLLNVLHQVARGRRKDPVDYVRRMLKKFKLEERL